MLVFSGDNYREIDNNYYCQTCAPQQTNQNSSLLAKIDEEMTEPQKQDIVDKIIENTNVPVKPKPMVSNIITLFLNDVIVLSWHSIT